MEQGLQLEDADRLAQNSGPGVARGGIKAFRQQDERAQLRAGDFEEIHPWQAGEPGGAKGEVEAASPDQVEAFFGTGHGDDAVALVS